MLGYFKLNIEKIGICGFQDAVLFEMILDEFTILIIFRISHFFLEDLYNSLDSCEKFLGVRFLLLIGNYFYEEV
jgi:hypothetical protein